MFLDILACADLEHLWLLVNGIIQDPTPSLSSISIKCGEKSLCWKKVESGWENVNHESIRGLLESYDLLSGEFTF